MANKKEEVETPEVEATEVPTEETTEVETPEEVTAKAEVPEPTPKPKRGRKPKAVESTLAKREMIGSKKVVSAELVDGMVHAKDSVGSGFKFTLEQWNSSKHLS